MIRNYGFYNKFYPISRDCRGSDCVENFKRRQALSSFGTVDLGSKLFFERILSVKKNKDFIFIPKTKARSR